jgi:phosphoserine phosphatase
VTELVKAAFATVVLDVDSTVSGVEGIDWLASLRGVDVADKITALTDRAMRGELALEAIYGARLAEIRPTRREIDALARQYVAQVAPGCASAVEQLRTAGVRVVLVSGGIREAMLPLAAHLGVNVADLNAVSIHFDERDNFAGFDERSPLATAAGKRTVIDALRLPRRILMVGDGATDLAARNAVDQFAAFTGFVTRATIVRDADVVLRTFPDLARNVLEHI